MALSNFYLSIFLVIFKKKIPGLHIDLFSGNISRITCWGNVLGHNFWISEPIFRAHFPNYNLNNAFHRLTVQTRGRERAY